MLQLLQFDVPRGDQAPVAARASMLLPTSLSAKLSAEDRATVESARPAIRTVNAGAALFDQGEPGGNVFLLLKGWAFRQRALADGRRQILDFSLPGAVLGLSGEATMGHGVEALSDCTVAVIARPRWSELLRRAPSLAVALVDMLAHAETLAFEHLTSVGRRTARERIANLFAELLTRGRKAGLFGGGARMVLPLTLNHIGDALGLTSVHVCRTLGSMRRDGVVSLRSRTLEVLDYERLVEEAGLDEEVAPSWDESTTPGRSGIIVRRVGPGRPAPRPLGLASPAH